MNISLIKIADTDLASRQAAAELRAQIEQHVLNGEKVSIDLGSVYSVSESYADELFGVLVLRHGLEWLSEHVTFHNAKPFVFRAIAEAIRQRISLQSPGVQDIALLAAKKALKQRQTRSI